MVGGPGSVPGTNSGRPRDTRDVWADLCGNSNSRGRMSVGQTGHVTGQMGHVHGTDWTHTRGSPAKILYVYWFLSFPTPRTPKPRKIQSHSNVTKKVNFGVSPKVPLEITLKVTSQWARRDRLMSRAKIAARQFLSLTCLAVALTAG